jgi:hypothetical protein
MTTNIEQFKCPTCDGYIPNNNHIGAYSGAISRRDNKTEICSPCGNREAMEDYLSSPHIIVMKGN